MAQNTTLAAATAAGTSTDIVVAAGAQVTVGLYTTSTDGLPGDARINVFIDTPGEDKLVFQLTPNDPVRVITGPGTFRGTKPASAVAYGLFHET